MRHATMTPILEEEKDNLSHYSDSDQFSCVA